MAHRVLKIKNFRNVGYQKEEELLLNPSTGKGEMGGLVILVGPNNSGKSNILSALTFMNDEKNKPFNQMDLPYFDLTSKELEVSMIYYDNNDVYGFNKRYSKSSSSNEYFTKINGKKTNYIQKMVLTEEAKIFAINYLSKIIRTTRTSQSYPNRLPIVSQIARNCVHNNSFEGYEDVIHDELENLYSNPNYNIGFIQAYSGANYTDSKVQSLIKSFKVNESNYDDISKLESINNFRILPTITTYNPLNFKNNELQVMPDNVQNSNFFKLVFNAIDYDIDIVSDSYKQSRDQSMPGILKKTNVQINEKLVNLSSQFNKLFQLNNNKYRFEITLETNNIYLTINLNDTPLNLDNQSTGFRWFFEFYFTLIAKNGLKRGDIIVMDEPATNLHPSGVTELRKFIKNFAEKNEFTFVISTHNPFFIDLNYLEEVRVVNRLGDNTVIQSKFHFVDDDENDDTDSLRPIKEALTVPRHVLVNPNTPTIFVEGITDYLYLTAFAQILKVKDYVFLPIQGLSKKNLFELLSRIEKKPILLVDGDKAGKEIKERASNPKYSNIEVITLTDIDSNFVTIESLFDPTEKMEKSFNIAATFKNRLINKGKVSKITKDNFQKLLTNLAS